MLPLRSHLSVATAALVLVVPVVAGVVVGGLGAGVASVAAGFLVYDFVFIPPYYTLTVGAAQNWVALGVYVVVMLLVAQVVAHLESARREAQQRAAETQRLFELSELLVKDRSVEDLLETIVTAVRTVFDVPGVALLLPVDGRLAIAASAGETIAPEELHQLDPESGIPVSVGTSGLIQDRAPDRRPVRLRPPGRHTRPPGPAGVGRRPGRAASLRQPRGRGRGAGPAARTGPALRAARGGRPAAARPPRRRVPRPAHPPGDHEGGLLDPARPRPCPCRTPTPMSYTASSTSRPTVSPGWSPAFST